MRREAFVDEMALASEFGTDDVVRKTDLRDFVLSPYVGRVLYSNPRTGKVTVQWPWGVAQESPVELVRDLSGDFSPPMLVDQSYSSYESASWTFNSDTEKANEKWRKSIASSIVKKYELHTMPLWRAACKAWHFKLDEVEAYNKISAALHDEYWDDTIKKTIANLYNLGRHLAIYWKDNTRKYKVTKREKASGRKYCPRCKSELKPRIYRQGQKILTCKTCGFAISPEDLTDE